MFVVVSVLILYNYQSIYYVIVLSNLSSEFTLRLIQFLSYYLSAIFNVSVIKYGAFFSICWKDAVSLN